MQGPGACQDRSSCAGSFDCAERCRASGDRRLGGRQAFDPADRPTCEEALADPYFAGLAQPQREPAAQPVSKLAFEFERRKLHTEEVPPPLPGTLQPRSCTAIRQLRPATMPWPVRAGVERPTAQGDSSVMGRR